MVIGEWLPLGTVLWIHYKQITFESRADNFSSPRLQKRDSDYRVYEYYHTNSLESPSSYLESHNLLIPRTYELESDGEDSEGPPSKKADSM